MNDYSMFKYYKGEKECPFDGIQQNTAAMFWDYERIFEYKFTYGNFSTGSWEMPTMTANSKKELGVALDANPVDKRKLFKIWLYNLLMEYLPDKYWSDDQNRFNALYWTTSSLTVARF